jgi:hypothetical protein
MDKIKEYCQNFYKELDKVCDKNKIDEKYKCKKKVLGFCYYKVLSAFNDILPEYKEFQKSGLSLSKISLLASLKQLDYNKCDDKDVKKLEEVHKSNIIDNLAFGIVMSYMKRVNLKDVFKVLNYSNSIDGWNYKSKLFMTMYEKMDKKFPVMIKDFKKDMLAYDLAKKNFLKYI